MSRLVLIAMVLGIVLLGNFEGSPPFRATNEIAPLTSPSPPEGCAPCRRPNSDELNSAPNVVELTLDESELRHPPRPGHAECEPASQDMSIEVNAVAEDKEKDVLTYHYTISGGRIVGQGARVHWNLAGVIPGTYTITAAADDGCGLCGRTVTQTVTVLGQPTCDCECPEVWISGPTVVEGSSDLTFKANIRGGSFSPSTYNWTITGGEIAEGQGTSSITVRNAKKSGSVKLQLAPMPEICSCNLEVTKSFEKPELSH